MRRHVPTKRTGKRAVIAKKAAADLAGLDDQPLSIAFSRDQKRVIVVQPYEVWVLKADTLELERAIELGMASPSVFEGPDEGVLWIGGQHLHRGSLWSNTTTKVGSKLGGLVDRVCLIRPTLLCGVGSHGEVLFDTEKDTAIHRRKTGERPVLGLVASSDGRAVFSDGSNNAWVVDPEHPSGYMVLRLRSTSSGPVPAEAVVHVGMTRTGQCILGARDGGIAWTNRALRLIEERFPRVDGRSAPLASDGDERWIFVLRGAGLLQRFLVAQPEPTDEDPEPSLPRAQQCRLGQVATCLALGPDGQLLLGGPVSDGQLGRLWSVNPADLEWSELPLTEREVVTDPVESGESASRMPSFNPTRTKVQGPALAQLKVDDVLTGETLWVTRSQGTLLDRAFAPIAAAAVKQADALLLPAMIRFSEGTARPALLLWPGVASDDADAPEWEWLTWGDQPQAWMPLRTPEIRAQGWTRRQVFPLQVALATAPPAVPGNRRPIPKRWADPELFAAMGRECKKLLKVLW